MIFLSHNLEVITFCCFLGNNNDKTDVSSGSSSVGSEMFNQVIGLGNFNKRTLINGNKTSRALLQDDVTMGTVKNQSKSIFREINDIYERYVRMHTNDVSLRTVREEDIKAIVSENVAKCEASRVDEQAKCILERNGLKGRLFDGFSRFCTFPRFSPA